MPLLRVSQSQYTRNADRLVSHEPGCSAACPTGACRKDEADGTVFRVAEECVGCGACAQACPYGHPYVIADKGISMKCDGCKSFRDRGLNPVCVDSCVMRALECGDIEGLRAAHPDAVCDLPILPDSSLTGPSLLVSQHVGAVPEAELFRAVDLDLVGQALDIMGVDETVAPAAPALLRTLRLAQGEDDQAEGLRDRLTSEYNRCFVGPRDLPAPPFESVYRDRKRIIMTETTLRVRMAYKASGYEPVLIHHVADDHIALELDFLASLADHAVDCAVAGNEDTAREYLKTSK
ncbi:molecular chaperone TorD family protein [bacterium]|nr:molecular chaperone TorD family protein [bacterium]